MKKAILLIICAAALAACSSAPKRVGINAVPAKVTKAIAKADKSCTVDADCAAVQKGCCMCAGYEAVNKAAAAALKPIWEKECALAACTLQMCYVEINTSCQQGTCVGTPKPMKEYFAQ